MLEVIMVVLISLASVGAVWLYRAVLFAWEEQHALVKKGANEIQK